MHTVIQGNDPLLRRIADPARQLFETFCKNATGHQTEDVVGAALNVLVNGLRQAHPTLTSANNRIDQLTAELKTLVAKNYDSLGRRRNGVFAFNQNIEMPLIDMREKK